MIETVGWVLMGIALGIVALALTCLAAVWLVIAGAAAWGWVRERWGSR